VVQPRRHNTIAHHQGDSDLDDLGLLMDVAYCREKTTGDPVAQPRQHQLATQRVQQAPVQRATESTPAAQSTSPDSVRQHPGAAGD
jgi:hypothetical protein